jgi:Domain of unknown function (DUF4112)
MMRPPDSTVRSVPSDSIDPARRARALARLLDESLRIPGTRIRLGLDPILGLIPGLGDVITTGIATVIIIDSARLGAPASTLSRMVANVLADTIVGAIPVAGDVLDVFSRANTRNIALLDRHLADPTAARHASRRYLLMVGGVVLLLLAGLLTLTLALLRWVIHRL